MRIEYASKMGRPPLGKVPTNLSLEKGLVEEAKKAAADEHTTLTAVVETLLRAWLKRRESKAAAKPLE